MSGDELFDEMLGVIRDSIDVGRPPRGPVPGPSEIGTPCDRRLGHRSNGTPVVNPQTGKWRPHVGTVLHAAVGERFLAANAGLDPPRWLNEVRVQIGTIGGRPFAGTVDLVDLWRRAIVDLKFVGPTTLKSARGGTVNPLYRTQVHCYAKGVARLGLPIETVAVLFLPSAGELNEAVWWSEPYDETVADEAITRAEAIAQLVGGGGPGALPLLSTAPAWCSFCPWYLPAATDLTEACPGHPPERAPVTPA